MKLNRQIHHAEAIARLVGIQDRNLLVFKQYLGMNVSVRGSEIITDASKEQIPLLEAIFVVLIELAERQIQ
ncbi:MAG: PhoH family protein, partial [Tenericutes bacterium HGW-Tenericutes-3]